MQVRSLDSVRALPSVDQVLRAANLSGVLAEYERAPVVQLIRATLEAHRTTALQGVTPPSVHEIAELVSQTIEDAWRTAPVRVINATGVVLHTNLGRAPLGAAAREAVSQAAAYSTVEYDLEHGERGSRHQRVAAMLTALTGAGDAHVTVNNAAAVVLALACTSRRREVIVSRGQAVEIGGGFRVPVIMKESGARLVEVGTTNRTTLDDYRAAFTDRTAAILHVHSSNFRVVGFTEEPLLADLARLAHEHRVPLLDDNGSGALLATERYGLRHEPTVQESVRAGADVVAFSGDKLLGGPQCGVLLGSKETVTRIRKHPLARAVRADKLTLAALSATLLEYLRGRAEDLPVWAMIRAGHDELAARAQRIAQRAAADGITLEPVPGESTVGGGSLPGETLPTVLLRAPARVSAAALRSTAPPVIVRTVRGRAMIDVRTVPVEDEEELLGALRDAYASGEPGRARGSGG